MGRSESAGDYRVVFALALPVIGTKPQIRLFNRAMHATRNVYTDRDSGYSKTWILCCKRYDPQQTQLTTRTYRLRWSQRSSIEQKCFHQDSRSSLSTADEGVFEAFPRYHLRKASCQRRLAASINCTTDNLHCTNTFQETLESDENTQVNHMLFRNEYAFP